MHTEQTMSLEDQLKQLNERNKQRAQAAIASMGQKYLCHPSNKVTRQKYQERLTDPSSVTPILSR